jgi:hypothetical protein
MDMAPCVFFRVECHSRGFRFPDRLGRMASGGVDGGTVPGTRDLRGASRRPGGRGAFGRLSRAALPVRVMPACPALPQ